MFLGLLWKSDDAYSKGLCMLKSDNNRYTTETQIAIRKHVFIIDSKSRHLCVMPPALVSIVRSCSKAVSLREWEYSCQKNKGSGCEQEYSKSTLHETVTSIQIPTYLLTYSESLQIENIEYQTFLLDLQHFCMKDSWSGISCKIPNCGKETFQGVRYICITLYYVHRLVIF